MKSICTFLLVVICLFADTNPLHAQWIQTDMPFGGKEGVSVFAVSDSNLFTGTRDGVYLSANNGTSWTAVNTGMTNTMVRSLAVLGANLFAGTNGGVFLSTNKGTSWTQVNKGLTNACVNALAVSDTNLFAGTNGGVFHSTNHGTVWTRTEPELLTELDSLLHDVDLSTGLTNLNVRALAGSGRYLFAGTDGGGVFHFDNPTDWDAANTGLDNLTVLTLALDGANLYAGTWGGGVFISTDNGTPWQSTNDGLADRDVRCLAVTFEHLFVGTLSTGVWRRPRSISDMLNSLR